MKKHLYSAKGKWVEELPRVLLAYKTTSWKPTRESPLALTYGMKAIVLTEIGMPTIRTEILKEANVEAITKDLNIIDKLREAVVKSIASYYQRLANLHNRHVKLCTFKSRELVLRRVFEKMANPTYKKFQPNWEGPYTVVRVGTVGSYALRKPNGTVVRRMWNSMHLKKYY